MFDINAVADALIVERQKMLKKIKNALNETGSVLGKIAMIIGAIVMFAVIVGVPTVGIWLIVNIGVNGV